MTSIDELMGFDSRSLDAFQEKSQANFNANIYKTNPKDSKSESGNYISRVKVIYNPFNVKQSVVHQATYYLQDSEGGLLVRSKLGDGDRSCPLFTAWKSLWFSGDEAKKNFSKEMFQKTESNWVLVQIIEDENRPELVGKFMVMKLAQDIYDKMANKMNPDPATKKTPVSVMDYLIGPALALNVQPGPDDPKNPQRKQREISYSLCDFEDDYTPITMVDGNPLFTDDELETIDSYYIASKDSINAKTEAKRNAAAAQKTALVPAIKELYKKALDYVKENAVDLEKECKYQPWDERTTERVNNWIALVKQGVDPKTVSNNPIVDAGESVLSATVDPSDPFASVMDESPAADTTEPADDLPF